MPQQVLAYQNRPLRLLTATLSPDVGAPTVLSSDVWDYVALWLRRQGAADALVYWKQSREFYDASATLSPLASPLTSYYALLNATKALLHFRHVQFQEMHGVSGSSGSRKTALKNEIVEFKTGGVLAKLCELLGEPVRANESYSLRDLLFNLPYLHRAFTLTYPTPDKSQLFAPLVHSEFVRKVGSSEAWFRAQVHERYIRPAAAALPSGWELEPRGSDGKLWIRRKKRFAWPKGKPGSTQLRAFTTYHQRIRQDVVPIIEPDVRWYLRKRSSSRIRKRLLPVALAAMHRLSEMARYEPLLLERHLGCQHNWLLTQFLQLAPAQCVHVIASEITGMEFLVPRTARL